MPGIRDLFGWKRTDASLGDMVENSRPPMSERLPDGRSVAEMTADAARAYESGKPVGGAPAARPESDSKSMRALEALEIPDLPKPGVGNKVAAAGLGALAGWQAVEGRPQVAEMGERAAQRVLFGNYPERRQVAKDKREAIEGYRKAEGDLKDQQARERMAESMENQAKDYSEARKESARVSADQKREAARQKTRTDVQKLLGDRAGDSFFVELGPQEDIANKKAELEAEGFELRPVNVGGQTEYLAMPTQKTFESRKQEALRQSVFDDDAAILNDAITRFPELAKYVPGGKGRVEPGMRLSPGVYKMLIQARLQEPRIGTQQRGQDLDLLESQQRTAAMMKRASNSGNKEALAIARTLAQLQQARNFQRAAIEKSPLTSSTQDEASGQIQTTEAEKVLEAMFEQLMRGSQAQPPAPTRNPIPIR